MRRSASALVTLMLILVVRAFAGAASLQGDVFVVDAGHGTRYPDGRPLNVGAVGPGGASEEAATLDVAERFAALLRAAGARVEMTRSHAHPYRIATERRLDNRARAALANRLRATAFISLHADSSTNPAARGTSVFWLGSASEPLARAVRERLRSLRLGESQFHPRHLAVTEEARVPAVLVELGFISNPEQSHQLTSPQFQGRLAAALLAATLEVFGR